jgi:hypothetical protein
LGRVSLLLPSYSLSLLLCLCLNRRCETSSIGWGAQYQSGLVGGGGCVTTSVIAFSLFSLLHVTVACASRPFVFGHQMCVDLVSTLSLSLGRRTARRRMQCDDQAVLAFLLCTVFFLTKDRGAWRERRSSQFVAQPPFRNRRGFHETRLSEGGRDMGRKALRGVRAALRISCVLFF